MPRKLENPRFSDPTWYRLSQFDIAHLPDLKRFLSILEFCDAVVTVAHDSVKDHLLSLIYMGFLEGVLKPALTQVSKYFVNLPWVLFPIFVQESKLQVKNSCENARLTSSLSKIRRVRKTKLAFG